MGLISNRKDYNVAVGVKLDQESFQKLEKNFEKVRTIEVAVKPNDANSKSTFKTITQYKSKIGDVAIEVEHLNKVTDEYNVKTRKEFNTTTTTLKTGVEQLRYSWNRFLTNFVSMKPIMALDNLVRSLFTPVQQIVEEYDNAMTEMKKVTQLAGDEINGYVKQLTQAGEMVSRTTTQMVSASTEFQKSGYSAQDSAELAKISSLFQNISDEEISASESAGVLISQMKAFNIEAEDAQKIVDVFNEVANNRAVSTGDLAQGMQQAGASLSSFNNTLEESVSLLTAGAEIFHGKSQQVARALNTIASRIVKNEDALKEYGIAIYDAEGNLRSTYQILAELSEKWDTLTDAQRISLGQTLAGTNQYKVFTAIMSNFDSAIESMNLALNSNGSAWQENETYMESYEAKVNTLKTNWEKFILSLQATNALKGIVDLIGTFIGYAGEMMPLVLMWTAKLAVSLALNSKHIQTLIAGFKTLWATVKAGNIAEVLAGNWITIALVGITAIAGVIKAINDRQDKLVESTEKYNARVSDIADNYKKLNNIQAEINALEEKKNALIGEGRFDEADDVQKTIDKLKEETAEIEKQNGELASRKNVDVAQASASGLSAYNSKKIQHFRWGEGGHNHKFANDTATNLLKYSLEGYKEYSSKLLTAQQEFNDAVLNNESKASIKQKQEIVERYQALADEYEKHIQDYVAKNEVLLDALSLSADTETQYADVLTTLGSAYEALGIETETIATADAEAEAQLEGFNEELETSSATLETYNEQLEQAFNDLNNCMSAYDTLTGVIDEYNQYGQVSVENLQKLLELDPEYLNCLVQEGDQLYLNTEALQAITEREVEHAKAIVYATAEEKLNNLAKADSIDAMQQEEAELAVSKGYWDEETQSINQNSEALVRNAYNRATAQNKASKGEADKIIRDMNNQLALLDKIGTTYSDVYTGVAPRSLDRTTSATNKTTDATKKLADAVKASYNAQIDGLNAQKKALQKQKEALQKQKEQAIKAIEAQIKAVQKQQKAEEKAIKKQISDLKEKREAEEKYWNEKINAFKEENAQLEIQIQREQLLQALQVAKSSQVKIFKDGRFQYGENEEAVSEAQQSLVEFERKQEYERQLKELEDARDKALEIYDQEIEDLEDYLERRQEYYEALLEQLEDYKERTEEYYDQLIEQVEEQIQAIEDAIEDLKAQMEAELQAIEATESAHAEAMSNIYRAEEADLRAHIDAMKAMYAELGGIGAVGASVGAVLSGINIATAKASGAIGGAKPVMQRYATGVSEVPSDQFAMVGDAPNKELVIGNKVNGKFSYLKKGDGVVNSKSTNTLAGMLNKLGEMGSSQIPNLLNNSGGTVNNYYDKLILPNVTDANSFVETMANYKRYAIQTAFSS